MSSAKTMSHISQQDHNVIQDTTRPEDHSHCLVNESQKMIKSSTPSPLAPPRNMTAITPN